MVPIPRLPAVSILSCSALFVLITSGFASVVPIKLVVASIPLLPAIDQFARAPLAPERFCQLAIPVASDTSTFPLPGLPPAIRTRPFTSNRVDAVGAFVQIHTLPEKIAPAVGGVVPLYQTVIPEVECIYASVQSDLDPKIRTQVESVIYTHPPYVWLYQPKFQVERIQLLTPISPFISSRYDGLVFHRPRKPVLVIRILSTLLVRNARSTVSIVPIKFDAVVVPEFPAMAHGITAHPDGVCQTARPVASDMSIFPAQGDPPVILICPFISSFAVGEGAPIPISQPLP